MEVPSEEGSLYWQSLRIGNKGNKEASQVAVIIKSYVKQHQLIKHMDADTPSVNNKKRNFEGLYPKLRPSLSTVAAMSLSFLPIAGKGIQGLASYRDKQVVGVPITYPYHSGDPGPRQGLVW